MSISPDVDIKLYQQKQKKGVSSMDWITINDINHDGINDVIFSKYDDRLYLYWYEGVIGGNLPYNKHIYFQIDLKYF